MNPSDFASMCAQDPIIDETVPYDEAVSRVRKTRRTVHLCVGMWAPYTVQAGVAVGKVRGTNTPGVSVKVTKAQALQFLDDAFPKHWRPKVSLRVGVSKRCMFIGSSPR